MDATRTEALIEMRWRTPDGSDHLTSERVPEGIEAAWRRALKVQRLPGAWDLVSIKVSEMVLRAVECPAELAAEAA